MSRVKSRASISGVAASELFADADVDVDVLFMNLFEKFNNP
jgi:hypothetical protein